MWNRVALFSRTPVKGELASSGQPGHRPQVLEQGAKLGLKRAGVGPLISLFLAFSQAVPTAKELHLPRMTVIPTHQHPARCHLPLHDIQGFPRRGVSLSSTLLQLFLCFAATFSGLRLWGRAQSPNFPNASSLLHRPLLGMADWGTRSRVAPSPLVGEGKLRPGGWLALSRGSSLKTAPDCGCRPWVGPGCHGSFKRALAFCGVPASCGEMGPGVCPRFSSFPDCRALFLRACFWLWAGMMFVPLNPQGNGSSKVQGLEHPKPGQSRLRGKGGENLRTVLSNSFCSSFPRSFQGSFWKSPRWKHPGCGKRQKRWSRTVSWSRTGSRSHHRLPL